MVVDLRNTFVGFLADYPEDLILKKFLVDSID